MLVKQLDPSYASSRSSQLCVSGVSFFVFSFLALRPLAACFPLTAAVFAELATSDFWLCLLPGKQRRQIFTKTLAKRCSLGSMHEARGPRLDSSSSQRAEHQWGLSDWRSVEVKINSLEVKGHWRSLQFRFRDRAILCSAFVRCVVTYCARACVQIELQLTPQKVCHV